MVRERNIAALTDILIENQNKSEETSIVTGTHGTALSTILNYYDREYYCSKNTDLSSLYGDKLKTLHLHDNDESADQHRMLFNGNINYKGPTALEVMNMGHGHTKDPSEFLAIAFDRAKRLKV